MKIFFGIVVVVIIIGALVLLFSPKPSEDLDRAEIIDIETTEVATSSAQEEESVDDTTDEFALAEENVTFSFTGFGPGKSHEGTFTDFSVRDLTFTTDEDVNIVPKNGTIAFQVDSVKTDSETLDGHLCAENFFDCENHSEITFDIVSVEKLNETDYSVTGNLQVKGITKQITVPASYAKGFAQSNFVVDMSQFEFSGPGVNPEVEVSISASLI